MATENKQVFWMDKAPEHWQDPLAAYGFADMLAKVSGRDVEIHDCGTVFRLTLSRALDETALSNAEKLGGLLTFIETKNAARPENLPIAYCINYEKEREKEANYFAALRNQTKRQANAAPDDTTPLPDPPHDDLPLFKLVNQMSALSAYNQIVQRWYSDQKYWPYYLELLGRMFSHYPNNLAVAEEEWKQFARANNISGNVRVTATQILNPTMGKGGDAAKANTASPGNKDSFWLLETLKFVGARVAALPLVVRESKDRKTYVPRPVHMMLNAHKRVFSELRKQVRSNTAVKMDVLAGLRYTAEFLKQWRDGNMTQYNLESSEPSDFVAGLEVAFYKDMGSALALLNLAQINLPNWMQVENGEAANLYLVLLQEHTLVVSYLDEKHSDEYYLLQLYRNFLSGHNLEPFYDFTAAYSHVLMSRLEKGQPKGQPALQFTTNNLEVLIMGHRNEEPEVDLAQIIKTPGFRNLATAIRLSTIVPQQQKARKQQPLYEIRYGLGEELKRKAAYPHDLAQALGEFVHSYNQETVQKLERTTQIRRKLVTDDDLDQVLSLLKNDTWSKTVGSLLIAYGYARDPKDPDSPNKPDALPEKQPDYDQSEDTMGLENEAE